MPIFVCGVYLLFSWTETVSIENIIKKEVFQAVYQNQRQARSHTCYPLTHTYIHRNTHTYIHAYRPDRM